MPDTSGWAGLHSDPISQPPIWLFDLEGKSFFLGFVIQVGHNASNHRNGCIPTIFARPRPMPPGAFNHHMSPKHHISNSQQQVAVQAESHAHVGSAYRRQQLTDKKRSQIPARSSNWATYTRRYGSQAQVGSTSRRQRLTVKKHSHIPAGPSNLFTYTSQYESCEHMAMGEPTNRGKKRMARKLREWEAHWKRLGGS